MTVYRFEDIAFNSTEKKKPVDEDKYAYIGLEHLNPDSIFVTKYGADNAPKGDKLIMKKGDVLFGKRRAYQKKVAIAPCDGIFSAHGMVLRPNEDVIDKSFFPLFIKSDYFLDEAIKISVGSLSPTINWKDLKELKFELPTLSEQKKLADVLWSIYETKEEYKELIEATDELVKSQFYECFEGDKYEYQELGSISKKWFKGQPFKKDYIVEDGVNPCIHYGELFTKYGVVINDVISFTNAEPVKCSKKGDILFPTSDVTPDGLTKCSTILCDDIILGGDIVVMRPDLEINSTYLSYAIRMQREQLLQRVTGSLVRHISAKSLKTVKIPIPPREKQDEFEKFIEKTEVSKAEINQSLARISELYKAIIVENIK